MSKAAALFGLLIVVVLACVVLYELVDLVYTGDCVLGDACAGYWK